MKVTLLGIGAFGRALSYPILVNGHHINIWTKVEQEVKEFNQYFKKYKQQFIIFNDIKECIKETDIILIAVSTPYIHATILELKKVISNKQKIVVASKGLEPYTGDFISTFLNNELPDNAIGFISGPSFAIDILDDQIIHLDICSNEISLVNDIKLMLQNNFVFLSHNQDMIGMEICGACKNILAVGMGLVNGLGLSESTKATFFTKAIQDIQKIILYFNGKTDTIISLAGIGDIFLSCTSTKSRNYTFGLKLGQNNQLNIKEYQNAHTVEGVTSLELLYNKLINANIDLGFINFLYQIIFKEKEPTIMIDLLRQ